MELRGHHFKWHKYFMEFHGTFHGIPWNFGAAKWSITQFHGIPWKFEIAIWWHFTLAEFPRDIPWNSMELWSPQIENHRIPWDSMELGGRRYKWHRCSMEFHGIFHGIPWNSGAAKWHITLFHGIPWNIPWNSMELWCRQMTYHLAPWNSMVLWHWHFMAFYPGWTSKSYSMEFHGTLELSNKKSWNSTEHSMEFHGILVPPNEVSLSSMEFHGSLRSPFYGILPWLNFQGIFHGIPWNSGLAK